MNELEYIAACARIPAEQTRAILRSKLAEQLGLQPDDMPHFTKALRFGNVYIADAEQRERVIEALRKLKQRRLDVQASAEYGRHRGRWPSS